MSDAAVGWGVPSCFCGVTGCVSTAAVQNAQLRHIWSAVSVTVAALAKLTLSSLISSMTDVLSNRPQRQPDELGGEAEPRGPGAGETPEHAVPPQQHR